MKSVLAILVSVFASVASASTIAVTGSGSVGQPLFSVNDDTFSFSAHFGLPGVHTVVVCNIDTPCDLTGHQLRPRLGSEAIQHRFQSGLIQGAATVTDASIVFPADWQNIPGFIVPTGPGQTGPLVPAFITANITGLQVPSFPSLNRSYPFFTASFSSEGTVALDGCGNVFPRNCPM